MRLKFWEREPPPRVSCPRCGQLVGPDAIECTMCFLDLRERYEPAPPVPAERTDTPIGGTSDKSGPG